MWVFQHLCQFQPKIGTVHTANDQIGVQSFIVRTYPFGNGIPLQSEGMVDLGYGTNGLVAPNVLWGIELSAHVRGLYQVPVENGHIEAWMPQLHQGMVEP